MDRSKDFEALSSLAQLTLTQLESHDSNAVASYGSLVEGIRKTELQPEPNYTKVLTELLIRFIKTKKNPPLANFDIIMIINGTCRLFSATRSRHLAQLVPVFLEIFPTFLTLAWKNLVVVYDVQTLLMDFAWKSAENLHESMSIIQKKIVEPYSNFLEKNVPTSVVSRSPGASTRIAYIMARINTSPGYAPMKLFLSWWKGHEALNSSDVSIFLYCVDNVSEEFSDMIDDMPSITIRSAQLNPSMHGNTSKLQIDKPASTLECLRDLAESDQIDVAIFEGFSGLDLYIMHSRIAPVQLYCPMSFIPLTSSGVDALMLVSNAEADARALDIPDDLMKIIPFCVDREFLDPPRTSDQVQLARNALPPAKTIFGTFCRAEKVSKSFVKASSSILKSCPGSILIIGGKGDWVSVESLYIEAGCTDNVVLMGSVDAHTVGRLIDVYLETFPIGQGLAGAEILAKGIPIVHMASKGIQAITETQRDPQTVAETIGEYVDLAVRLAQDENFWQSRSEASRAIITPMIDIKTNTRAIEDLCIYMAQK